MVLHRRRIMLTVLTTLTAPRVWSQTPQATSASPASPPHTTLRTRPAGRFEGDFDAMLERRMIRLVVPYSRTFFFRDKGEIYGTAVDGAQLLETWINRTFKLGARPLTVTLTPVSRDKLFDTLLSGDGDLAAGDITITEARSKIVAFTAPIRTNVREIIVTGDNTPDLASAEALSGKEVVTRRSTSYYESLIKLNERIVAMGKPPVTITLVPDTLESEDLMEMTAVGLLPPVVVDDWIAELWVQIIKGLKLHTKAILREGAEIAWAVRPTNPKFLDILNRAIGEIDGKTNQWSGHTMAYLAKLKQLHSATQGADMQRFRDTLAMFQKYGNEYGFDTLLLLAQGFQESRLDQSRRSAVGALGLMQLMPQTGNALGVGDIHYADPNVHAGAKYMAELMDVYFKGVPFDEQNRTLFAFAAYNAGPGKIQSLRREAEAQGLDPNVWFDNVERVAAARVGQEPVRYVRNIYKYFIAYKLIEETATAKKAAIVTTKMPATAPSIPAEP
jgi:membrane-bound lytic murein transglycosylase MltF